jgi:tight adherence protein C
MDQSLLIMLVATFGAVVLLIYGLFTYISSRHKLQERFVKSKTGIAPLVQGGKKYSSIKGKVLEVISSFGKMTLRQEEKSKISDLRLILIQAGFRYANSVAVFYGIKIIGTIVFPLCFFGYVMFTSKVSALNPFIALGAAALGYYFPNVMLKRAVSRRRDRIDKALPDVLDLIIVTMEAGLSLQSTLNHVVDEVHRICKDLYQELRITNAELRTGIPRDRALKNLGERTGVESINSLISLMIQSDKMGASIAQSLRTHADFIRVQRAQRAEELAAKMPVKIIFPTLFCMLPAIFVVVLGPAVIQIYHVLIKK